MVTHPLSDFNRLVFPVADATAQSSNSQHTVECDANENGPFNATFRFRAHDLTRQTTTIGPATLQAGRPWVPQAQFVGFAAFNVSCADASDGQLDQRMDRACAREHGNAANGACSRAASTHQLIRGLIDGLPIQNTGMFAVFTMPEPPECVALRRSTSPDAACWAASGDDTGHHRNAVHPSATWPEGFHDGRNDQSGGWDDTSNARQRAVAVCVNATAPLAPTTACFLGWAVWSQEADDMHERR